jgi:hypothetical protein
MGARLWSLPLFLSLVFLRRGRAKTPRALERGGALCTPGGDGRSSLENSVHALD